MEDPNKVFVTNHCLVRFIERVRGFDLSEERRTIETICSIGISDGSVKSNGFIYEITTLRRPEGRAAAT
jgi:hypothetical protein